jgi:hypothetical protein
MVPGVKALVEAWRKEQRQREIELGWLKPEKREPTAAHDDTHL